MRFNPDANITLYEAADRLGGWVDTERVDVKTQDGEHATISFERGARTIAPQTSMSRWEDFVFFDLVDQLGLLRRPDTAPYAIPKHHPVLSKRYIYYPDHLVEAPGAPPANVSLVSKIIWGLRTMKRLLTEPVFKGLFPTVHLVWTREKTAQKKFLMTQAEKGSGFIGPARYAIADHTDVSVGEFFARHTANPDLVTNMLSALFHGIWGGDVWKLSAAETNMQNFFLQSQHFGTELALVKEHDYHSGKDIVTRNPAVVDVMEQYGPKCSYIGFHNGFSALSEALAGALKSNPKVTIKTGHPVTAIRYEGEEEKAVVESSNGTHKYDKVISSLYSGTLAKLTGDSLPALKRSTAVTIQIVNLWYPNPDLTAHTPGFGYLIPQSVPAEKNPHAALGVIFDSDREAAAGSPEYTAAPGTKLTVMLGGHYWDYLDPESWPNAEEATAMAIDTVERQLGIPSTEPVYTSTKVCRECIPQHLVGHRARMAQAHTELYDAFRGTLAVVGGSYTSPGVLPTLKAARDMALMVSGYGYKDEHRGFDRRLTHVGETGLAKFHGKNEKFRFVPHSILPFRGKMTHRAFNWKT
ncbi:oxygen-dependent protoporphyrinogen oxidase [Gnomoniopsis smithogilvyi]|uniref:Oxygen-dependent protoporphyrinogen oxidase n=1 Tax=Gnomoniopsis smithogilvyi TaxID=1191159 RepID=A0A9W8YYV7_9PEZI|nr:oxygen-dependent protoporphyrinogen oxidase [Gnomoniopsis smithogilvyi]